MDKVRIGIVLCAIALCASTLRAQSYTISTIAGGGQPPTAVSALGVRVPISGAVAISSAGEVYFTSGNSVLKVDASGVLTRFAGTGQYGLSGDGGPALQAELAWPAGLALDNSGNLFIADNANHRVRKVSPGGTISTVVGSIIGGSPAGYSGDGGPAANAQLNWPTALTFDASGNLYIADSANQVIRKVSSSGIITTTATGLDEAEGVAVDSSGNLYISDFSVSSDDCGDAWYTGRVLKVAPGGTTSTVAQGLSSPRGMAVDPAGNVYVADEILGQVIRISSSGAVTTAAGSASGQVYSCPADYFNSASPLICPAAVAIDNSGNVYVSDTGHARIARISPLGNIANVVGDGAPGNYWGDGGKATDAALDVPLGVAVDASGNLYIADTQNSRVRKVTPGGIITTVAGNGTPGYSGDGGPAISAQLKGPTGLAVDASGNLYIADELNNRIRKVSANGIISTVAGRGDSNVPLGDGGPATGAALAGPSGVAVDSSGNLYIADTYFFDIRKVSPDGIITTVAGHNFYTSGPNAVDLPSPTGVVLGAGGNLYIASGGSIRKLSPDGTLSTVAGTGQARMLPSGDGGPATSAALAFPLAVALDAVGNLYVAGGDLSGYFALGDGSVRKVTSNGIISTIAGNGTSGYSGDGGTATSASLSPAAYGIAVDAAGNIYVADVYNNVIRVLRPAPKQ